MPRVLKPWTRAAFSLILHAEEHRIIGDDFDRSIAHISFDNAIEVIIAIYLKLNPIQRKGKQYPKEDVRRWLTNFHTKLEFLVQEAQQRNYILKKPIDEIAYYHDIRNKQYHEGDSGIPVADDIYAIREAALDVFAMLFDIPDIEQVLDESIKEREAKDSDQKTRNDLLDKLLDFNEEAVIVAGIPYATSDLLFATDYDAYRAFEALLEESRDFLAELKLKYPKCLKPSIAGISFVHFEEKVYLKTRSMTNEIQITDAEFSSLKLESRISSSNAPDENVDLLINEFDPLSIIDCFDMFTDEAARKIAEEFKSVR
ncbi:hypothetical protein [Mesotoga prima]|uniref:hypothetical protein n=1 Tax=Mesotoga prima TaxID=1184387 RepID=UPI002FE164C9